MKILNDKCVQIDNYLSSLFCNDGSFNGLALTTRKTQEDMRTQTLYIKWDDETKVLYPDDSVQIYQFHVINGNAEFQPIQQKGKKTIYNCLQPMRLLVFTSIKNLDEQYQSALQNVDDIDLTSKKLDLYDVIEQMGNRIDLDFVNTRAFSVDYTFTYRVSLCDHNNSNC